MPITISKSLFVAGWQCLKRLHLLVHKPALAGSLDAIELAIIEQGRQVGELARELFPDGVIVRAAALDEAIRITRDLVVRPDVATIFEAAFEYRGIYVRVDILQRRRDNRWRLIEVKSSAHVKDEYIPDVAIQAYVVSHSRIDLASSFLAHVNRGYVYEGGVIDPWKFFKIRNLTRRIEKLQPKLLPQLQSELRMLSLPQPPEIVPGPHCTDPATCEFFDTCNQPIPDEHISHLPGLRGGTVRKLEELGITFIRDIPDDFALNEQQRRACTSVQTGQPWLSAELGEVLGSLRYPLYFMDFETVNPAIPRFLGMHPYDQIPFQWSVHVQNQPGTPPEHYEFLASDTCDPRRHFISSLCEALGQRCSIVVYNASFESQRLGELASFLPEFAQQIENIQSRLWDLFPIIRDHVYHPAFAGSYSLKAVLPAFVPEMTYEGMEVADGQDAGLAWESMIRGTMDREEEKRVKTALLNYCGQDTLGLVRLLDKLWLVTA
jgi:predicted RecB family nuclease